MELDGVPLWRGDHVSVRQLAEDFARCHDLPRLTGPHVLVGSVRDGLGLLMRQQDGFAYADSVSEVLLGDGALPRRHRPCATCHDTAICQPT
jgi:hypothetical protein